MTSKEQMLASPKQLKWLKSLIKREWTDFDEKWVPRLEQIEATFAVCEAQGYDPDMINILLASQDQKQITMAGFDYLLERLNGKPFRKTEGGQQLSLGDEAPATEDGYYKHDGTYFRVVHNRAGTNQYAHRMKFLMSPEEAKALAGTGTKAKVFTWVYAPGVFGKLKANEMVEDQTLTEAFGGLYSACCRCGALLNDPLSVKLNIGPVCGGRVFGEKFKGMLKQAKAELEYEETNNVSYVDG